jgi:hypothetical protein
LLGLSFSPVESLVRPRASALHSQGGRNWPLHMPACAAWRGPPQGRTARRSGGRPTVGPADRYYAAVAIPVLGLAGHHTFADAVVGDLSGSLRAGVGLPFGVICAADSDLQRRRPGRHRRIIVSATREPMPPILGRASVIDGDTIEDTWPAHPPVRHRCAGGPTDMHRREWCGR